MNMRPTLLTLALALLLIPVTAHAQILFINDAQIVSARAGVVSRVEGDVWYRRRDEQQTQQLSTGVSLSVGDLVWTGSRGRAEWSLNPGSSLQVGPRSQVRVYETSLEKMHFDIERGEVFAVVKPLDDGAALVLDTPPALLNVIRSGRYRVRVATDNGTEAAVSSGELRFINQEGKTVRIMKRQRVRFAATKGEDHGAWARPHTFREK